MIRFLLCVSVCVNTKTKFHNHFNDGRSVDPLRNRNCIDEFLPDKKKENHFGDNTPIVKLNGDLPAVNAAFQSTVDHDKTEKSNQ